MKKLGRHILAEFTDCDRDILNDYDAIRSLLTEAARQSGATIVDTLFHEYNPHGLSGVIVIAESHISIHTWPEYGYASVDFFTCGERVNPWDGCRYLEKGLGSKSVFTREFDRGIPSEQDEVLPHKPMNLDYPNREVA
ncbi:MAG: adenosylmethionine decarboxylase [Candidatus Zixiibacteriota bacterium]